ncbi:MAG: DinB family protein [Terracidiphilus sp.]
MKQDLEHTIALLTRTPATLDALLRDLPDAWTKSNEGGNTWSVRTVVAHLIHGEHEDWLPRTKMILQSGEAETFAPFDREGHVRYSQGKTLGQLLDEFAQARTTGLYELRAMNLTPEDMNRRGRHPALGTVTLRELLATWAAHDLTHLHQISRIMAYQYREAVGPWARFMGVMQCSGHSSTA